MVFAHDDLERTADWHEGTKSIEIITHERAPGTEVVHLWKRTYTSSFEIRSVETRGADELVLLGRAPDDDDVIELWRLHARRGGWSGSRPASDRPIGTPSPRMKTRLVVRGGTFLPPAQREGEPELERDELYRGSDLGVRDLGVDPDGRFVLFLGDARPGLYLLPLHGERSAPRLLTTPRELDLSTADELYAHDHRELGRTWWIEHGASPVFLDRRSLLFDSDNDGLIESCESRSEKELRTLYPDEGWDFRAHDWWR